MLRLHLNNGLTVESEIDNTDLWERMLAHYAAIDPHYSPDELWACPWCGGTIDNSSSEANDSFHEDTYHCEGECDLLITHTTPRKYTQYRDVPLSEWKVTVESRIPNFWLPPDDTPVPTVEDDEP